MKTNCFLYAWERYKAKEATWMAFRASDYSKLKHKMPFIVRIVGHLLFYPTSFLWFISHYLVLGTWPHFVYCDKVCGCKEYVPIEKKDEHLSAPLIFDGTVQDYDEDN